MWMERKDDGRCFTHDAWSSYAWLRWPERVLQWVMSDSEQWLFRSSFLAFVRERLMQYVSPAKGVSNNGWNKISQLLFCLFPSFSLNRFLSLSFSQINDQPMAHLSFIQGNLCNFEYCVIWGIETAFASSSQATFFSSWRDVSEYKCNSIKWISSSFKEGFIPLRELNHEPDDATASVYCSIFDPSTRLYLIRFDSTREMHFLTTQKTIFYFCFSSNFTLSLSLFSSLARTLRFTLFLFFFLDLQLNFNFTQRMDEWANEAKTFPPSIAGCFFNLLQLHLLSMCVYVCVCHSLKRKLIVWKWKWGE